MSELVRTIDIPVDNRPITLEEIYAEVVALKLKQAEFVDLAQKLWGFVEEMKTNPMLGAMLGGFGKRE